RRRARRPFARRVRSLRGAAGRGQGQDGEELRPGAAGGGSGQEPGHHEGRIRSGGLSVSRARQSGGRRRAQGRTGVLMIDDTQQPGAAASPETAGTQQPAPSGAPAAAPTPSPSPSPPHRPPRGPGGRGGGGGGGGGR